MGWTIAYETEDGHSIRTLGQEFDYTILERIEQVRFNRFRLLKYIDPYGDTVFNTLQINDLVSDLIELQTELPGLQKEIKEIIDLAIECKQEVHTYLKFYGD